jgi:hypothetical protein
MDIAGICSYERHQEIVDHFLRELQREPLHEFAATTLEQVSRADRYLFTRIADLSRNGLKRNVSGDLPVENSISRILLEPAFVLLTMQMAKRSSSGGGGGGGSVASASDAKIDSDKAAKKRKHEAKMASDQAAKQARMSAKGSGKSQSSGKAAGKGKGPRMPPGLIGMDSTTSDGKRLCFGYNLGTCTSCDDGDECSKGWHLCCKPKCHKAHPLQKH